MLSIPDELQQSWDDHNAARKACFAWDEKNGIASNVEVQEDISRIELKADGLRTADHFGLEEGHILRGSNTVEDHASHRNSSGGEYEQPETYAREIDIVNSEPKRPGDVLADSKSKRTKVKVIKKPIHLEEFDQAFQSMVKSGNSVVVVDLWKMYYTSLEKDWKTNSSLYHTFVVDPWNRSYRVHDVFTDEEIVEIKATKKKQLPQIPDELFQYLMSYEKLFIRDQNYDLDRMWSSMYNIVLELEADDTDS
ncbi:hypothetical protein BDA99DRAFT_558457 [Phascolomyces articulosus]|uniref:Uncharacterized protein n=1 Tax=Phascolomyces articulosus TaxID=60185 RepID=A0AAD5PHL7_9FUNG|nr:hypothetical protein BDA99DRAFT_558457 [Phascolomyces articulosus]